MRSYLIGEKDFFLFSVWWSVFYCKANTVSLQDGQQQLGLKL